MYPRIISGQYKNRKIKVPESARPYTDRVKQSLFDTISDIIPDATVADICAGSGNIGIEAVSRGARHCTFVERNDEAVSLITQNCKSLSIPENQYIVVHESYQKFLRRKKKPFDIIFFDPPFDDAPQALLKKMRPLMHDDSFLIFRFDTQDYTNVRISQKIFTTILSKTIGTSTFVILKKIPYA